MELKEAVKKRRSVRRFLDKPVPEDIIQEIISDARWAPSWGNTQTTEVFAATGEVLEKFKKANREAFTAGKKSETDVPFLEQFKDSQMKRYGQIGKTILKTLAIDRADKEGRADMGAWMANLFDAPAFLVFAVDKSLPEGYPMLDAGLFLQNICLLAHDKGLGTCIMALAVAHPDIIREIIQIPDSLRILIGVALGWPDPAAKINQFERVRADAGEVLTFVK